MSLSARRAWIEILLRKITITVDDVALRKESVDRNCDDFADFRYFHWSLSARRAWIEITTLQGVVSCPLVALRKESVDRNSWLSSL